MKIVSIHDNNGNKVEVNLEEFVKHINEFHKNGISIHEERGHYFTVDDKFRKKLIKMITK
tara:strand:- start:96 stop:275 length:180 start_codon:yes stop_codon:yes gene_type:complete